MTFDQFLEDVRATEAERIELEIYLYVLRIRRLSVRAAMRRDEC